MYIQSYNFGIMFLCWWFGQCPCADVYDGDYNQNIYLYKSHRTVFFFWLLCVLCWLYYRYKMVIKRKFIYSMCRIIYDVKNSCLGCLGSSQTKLMLGCFTFFSLNRHILSFFLLDCDLSVVLYNCGLLCCQLIYSIVCCLLYVTIFLYGLLNFNSC